MYLNWLQKRRNDGWGTNIDIDRIHAINLKQKEENGVFDILHMVYSDVREFGTFEFINNSTIKDKKLNELVDGFIGDYIIDYD